MHDVLAWFDTVELITTIFICEDCLDDLVLLGSVHDRDLDERSWRGVAEILHYKAFDQRALDDEAVGLTVLKGAIMAELDLVFVDLHFVEALSTVFSFFGTCVEKCGEDACGDFLKGCDSISVCQ